MAVSVAVCEIFSVREWCDLENRVSVRSRSLEMALFDRSHMSSYSPSIVTMAISCIVCELWRLICRKSRSFYTPPVFSAPAARGWPRLNFVKVFDAGKTRMIGLPYGEKTYDDMLSRFHLIPERYWRTDRRTNRRTDLLYQYRASVCWRAIKSEGAIDAIRYDTIRQCTRAVKSWRVASLVYHTE